MRRGSHVPELVNIRKHFASSSAVTKAKLSCATKWTNLSYKDNLCKFCLEIVVNIVCNQIKTCRLTIFMNRFPGRFSHRMNPSWIKALPMSVFLVVSWIVALAIPLFLFERDYSIKWNNKFSFGLVFDSHMNSTLRLTVLSRTSSRNVLIASCLSSSSDGRTAQASTYSRANASSLLKEGGRCASDFVGTVCGEKYVC